MNLEYKYLLDGNFHPDSKVWVYQSNRIFSMGEALEIEDLLKDFISKWTSHGATVKGEAHLFFGQFIVLIADETATTVGGCSTDSSVRMIKGIEKRYAVNMFDRTTLAFVVKDKVQMLPMQQLQYAVDNGFINDITLHFNNLVATKKELVNNWIVPLKDSWLAKRISFLQAVN
ncbi:MAG: hypothetical protein IPH18_00410 [Chitinophagaceae bacterium]|nr:hypothetical protein [Chitinophagaceae bacterium]MBK8951521.1 hypothetical protein [Chitinophagaceae bacterium]